MASHYEGLDSRVTSQKELWGWYSYSIAAEVFAVVGIGSFLPVTLEQLARETGVLRKDGITPCVQVSSRNHAALVRREESPCVLHILGAEVNSSSFVLYSTSLSVFFQTLVLISIGAIADYGDYRKRLLLTFAAVGSTACMLFIFIFPQIYLLGSLLTIISVASLGSSFVLLNAFLPLLAANHPSVRGETLPDAVSMQDLSSDRRDSLESSASAALLDDTKPPSLDRTSPALLLSNRLSSTAVGLGYAAALLVQFMSIGLLVLFSKFKPSSTTISTRAILLLVGVWWAAFAIPTALWLHRRPGPPLPVATPSVLRYVSFAWASLFRTAKLALKLKNLRKFLFGWFLLSDAIATISGTAILFAKTELQLGSVAIALLSVTATASGIVGAAAWPRIARRYDLSSRNVILLCVGIFEIIPLYGLLGFVPAVQRLGWLGLQRGWEVYPLAFILGFVMGGLSSYCRSVYGELIPRGMEGALYALYAVTDKGSSVIGPAVVGRIIDVTGSIRWAFVFLAVLMVAPMPFFLGVDVGAGRNEAMKVINRGRGDDEQ